MKITLVGHTTPQSGVNGASLGIAKNIYYLGTELNKLGEDVELIIRNDYRPMEKWIKPIYSPKFTWFVYPYFLGKAVKNVKSDIYHADYVTTGSVLVKNKKSPSVVTIHDVIPFTYDKSEMKFMDRMRLKWYMKAFKSMEKADAIITDSQFAKEQAVKLTNIQKEKIFTVYNGLDQNKFFPMDRIEHNKIRIGYLGGLDGRKNVKLLVEAFSELRKNRDDIELHVAGGGTNLEIFRKMKIRDAKFYGFIPDSTVNEFLNSLDIFVFPTLGEGFGLPVLEAMATGATILAANTTSMPEVVGDSGILFEPNIKDLIEKLNRCIDNKSLRNKLSKMGINRSKRFTWEKCARDTLKIYKCINYG